MRISELFPNQQAHLKRVGIRFPERAPAMQAAVKLYREHGIDVEIQDTVIWYDTVQPMGAPVMGLLERATGTRAFNEWET